MKIFYVETYVLYNISGYILSRIAKYNVHCTICLDSAGLKTECPRTEYAKFVKKRCYKDDTLFFVNEETFKFFQQMEIDFRRYISYLEAHYSLTQIDFVLFSRKSSNESLVLL